MAHRQQIPARQWNYTFTYRQILLDQRRKPGQTVVPLQADLVAI